TSIAYDINDAGQVVVASFFSDPINAYSRAFISGPDGGPLRDLGVHQYFLSPLFINSSGEVAGTCFCATAAGSASCITGPDGGPVRYLGTLGGFGTQSYVTGINDAGQVMGESTYVFPPTGYTGFISGVDGGLPLIDLRTLGVPEPTPLALLAFAFAAMGLA